MHSKASTSHFLQIVWIIICLALAAVAFTTMLDWGDIDRDEVYQTWSVFNWHKISVAPLSHFIGNQYISKMGGSVVHLRCLSMLIAVSAIFISCIYTLFRTRNLWLSTFLFAAMAWLWRTEGFILYNWDSGSLLWDTLALICTVEYFRKPALLKSIFCGITFALMTLGRIPSGIILPLFILLLIIFGIKSHNLKNTLAGSTACILSFAITSFLLLTLLYGNITDYLASIHNNSISGHSLTDPSHYIWRLIFLLPIYLQENLIAALCLLLPLIFRKRLSILIRYKSEFNFRTIITISLIFLSAIILSIWLSKSCLGPDTQCFYGAGCSLAVGLLLAVPVRNFSEPLKQKISLPAFQLWGCALILLAVSFGSDAFCERILGCYTVPVIIAVLWSLNNNNLKFYCLLVLSLAFPCFVSVNLVHWNKLEKECTYFYGENLRLFEGITASRNIAEEYSDFLPAISSLEADNKSYILLGDRHTMTLLFGEDAGPGMNQFHFRSNKPYSWTPNYLDYLVNTDALVFSETAYNGDIELQSTVRLMLSKGFSNQKKVGKAIILTKNAPESNR